MNQTQRKFLIDKIEKTVDARIKALQSSIPEAPSLNIWLLHAVLSNNFELKSIAEIKEVIRQKALNAKEREDWLGNHWGSANKSDVHFKASELFMIPDEYRQKADSYRKERTETEEQIRTLRIQADTLITRIQLASDKTLQRMINEVDDMGDISLIDTKLKFLTTSNEKKEIESGS